MTSTGRAPASPARAPDLERSIARVLTLGTYASIGLLVVGFVLMLADGIGPLSGGPDFDPSSLVPDLVALRPAGFIWLGLIAAVATPVARDRGPDSIRSNRRRYANVRRDTA
jgi:hypothetical protein